MALAPSAPPSAAMPPPLEAEVPQVFLNELSTLEKALIENRKLYAQIKDMDGAKELRTVEEKMVRLGKLVGQQKSAIKAERMKSAELAHKLQLDQRIGQNVQRNKAEPQYGRARAVDYMHELAAISERQLDEQWAAVQRMHQMLDRLDKSAADNEDGSITRRDLSEHLQRFDKIFESVATQVYALNDATEKLKDCYLDQRREFGRFGFSKAEDPFQKHKERQRIIDAYSSLKGVEAFPSPNALLSLGEFLPRQPTAPGMQQQPQFGITPFGGSVFGTAHRPPAPSAFSFNTLPHHHQQLSSAPTSSSLFGAPPAKTPLFGTGPTAAGSTSSSLFGTNPPAAGAGAGPAVTSATAPSLSLFGAQPQQPAPSSSASFAPPFGFSNTLSSASSGTLFKGSAPSPSAGSLALNKPSSSLFGAK